MICQCCGKSYTYWGNSQGLCKWCWADINNERFNDSDIIPAYYEENPDDYPPMDD
jgi:predicted amidophosphoribosyltransferase